MQRETVSELSATERLAWPGFVLDLGRGELLDEHDHPVELRAQALRVLVALGQRCGRVVGKDELMQRVWGDVVVTEDSLVQAIGDIRRALGDEAHRRVRTVPRRGYLLDVDAVDPRSPAASAPHGPATGLRAIAHLEAAAAGDRATPPPPPPAPPSGTGAAAAGRRRARPLVLGITLLLTLAAGAAGLLALRQSDAPPRTLAILPFDKDAATEDWFVDGVTGELTTIVAGWRDVQVIGRGTMATYKGRANDPREVGQELGVRHVLAGRARRTGERVHLSVELVDSRSGRIVWTDQRDVPRAELGAAVGEVAGGISRALVGGYGDAIATDTRKLDPHQVQADDLALQGMAELLRSVSREHFDGARRIFEAGLGVDPDCRRCLAGVSLANTNLALWEWADDRAAAIERAEKTLARLDQLAPDMMPAQLAHASLTNLRHDWAGLLAVGDRLVDSFPYEPAAHHHRCSALLRLGRFDESIKACATAMRISPRDSRVATWQGLIGFNEFQRGNFAAAEQVLRASVTANPRVAFYGVVLAAAIAEQGRRDEAVIVIADNLVRHPTFGRGRITGYWVATEAHFVAGRDRIIALAGELGLPP